jgi:hypothetical protein
MLHPRGIFAVALAILLVGLAPLAYAEPPDPTWLGGYWDDDDFDTVVAFVTSATAVFASPVVHDFGLLSISDDRVELTEPSARSILLQTPSGPRAPPIRLSADN